MLWTCHIFGNQSVPPVIPFNMGSLGFLTPFDPADALGVLQHVMEGEGAEGVVVVVVVVAVAVGF